ncbi:two-component system, sporulation sensor kinase D [Bacillus ectoiniformans]|uniref:PAS domain-containing sensor histidine kinase n=1 Tax=Bacillus ectoiniformans TaxID=1494429 RepID=UPI00195E960A|nr:PAS domain-containing sensor histidine kinase [Bacillus ectoiniformans]MBM7647327.1 two-component system, sporulation sensor kinase D [Bacillus ectoiniformans]
MKNKKTRMIYLAIVIIPTLLSILFFYQVLQDRAEEQRNTHLEWVANIHKNQMDQFISEIKVSLSILAVSAEDQLTDLNKVQNTLKKTAGKDPRYGGIYILDFEGNVQTGTNDLLKQYNLRNKPYIKDVLLTKDIVISNEAETLTNNQPVIAIATPVMKEDEVSAILMAHMRLDYMRNIIGLLTPDQHIVFENAKQIPIFTVDGGKEKSSSENSVKYPLSQLPWNIVISDGRMFEKNVMPLTLLFAAIVMVTLHIAFVLLKYVMLKQQTKVEKMQQESQKLELIGTLAAGTAHEIRNPLTGIKGLVQLLNEKYNDPEDEYYYSIINKEIARINQIVSEFLILGKPTAQRIQVIDIRDILSDVSPLISSEANLYSMEFNMVLPDEETLIKINVDQLKQVILNLTKNAFEAMSEGGHLSLVVDKGPAHCQLTISDTGIGIEQDQLELIFKPFYTSKENGTGLGLVVCKRIIDSFDGIIEVDSEEGNGTNIYITLPLHQK